ncbi:MFS transporter [Microlunatus sp. GCM10028923]|uniref:MFS transporter n=1 Tax=Microlunatus sp. GCM10028923 TaxID=3273400 RepID=UPI00361CA249
MTTSGLRSRGTEGYEATGRTLLPGVALIAVTFGLARYGYGLLLPELRSEFALSEGLAGLIASATYAAYLFANVAVVVLMKRYGARATIGLAAALAAGGMMIMAVAANPAVLTVGVLVAGAASGLALPPYSGLVATRVEPRRRDRVWPAISSGTGWGVALAGPVAIVAGDRWRLVWATFVVVAVGVGVAAVLLAPRKESGSARMPQLSPSWFVCPKSRPLLVSAVLLGLGSAVWWAFCVDALREAGHDPAAARIVYAVCGAAGILATAGGSALGRWGLRRGYLISCLLLAGAVALLGLALGHLATATAAAILFGVFYNGTLAVQGIWSSRVFAEHPVAGLAAVNVAVTLGTLIGPALAGIGADRFGYGPALVGAAVVVALAAPFCPPSARRRRRLAEHRCRAAPVRP